MPESTNITLLELSGRFQAGGIEAVKQRYPEDKHFLVIPPEGSGQPSIVWTSQDNPITNSTALTEENKKRLLGQFANPKSIITPICKKGRNQNDEIIFGRDNKCDIRFASKEVSKLHASLKIKNDRAFLQDLESTNGTFINQCHMMPNCLYHVTPGQEVTFGTIRTAYIDLEHLLELVTLAT